MAAAANDESVAYHENQRSRRLEASPGMARSAERRAQRRSTLNIWLSRTDHRLVWRIARGSKRRKSASAAKWRQTINRRNG